MSPGKRSTPVLISVLIGVIVTVLLGRFSSDRPNLVVIVVDTLRASSVSFQPGNIETPNIATLAREGVAFPLAFSHAPMTGPAHASLFSGRHPFETGVRNNGQDVPANVPLLAEHLRIRGYQTAAVVSLATMWPQERHRGLDRGFQSYDAGEFEVAPAEDTSRRLRSTLDQLDPDDPFFLLAHLSDPHEPYNDQGASGRVAMIRLDGKIVDEVTTSQMSYWDTELELGPGTHRLTLSSEDPFKLRSLEVTERGRDVPFKFASGALLEAGKSSEILLPNTSTGTQTVRLRAWINDCPSTTEIHARYAAEVQAADAAIGRLVAELMKRGMWENTLVVLTSDHGEALGEHGVMGHVVNLYDELLHVPLVIRLPHGLRDSRLTEASETIVRHIDVAPTILDLLELPRLARPSGRSLLEGDEEILIAETHSPEAPRTLFCLRDRTYKMIYAPEDKKFELYRLGPDPLELDNVFSHQGHLRETWKLVLEKLAAEMGSQPQVDSDTTRKLSALGY
jgi:membrane-anchored protein YejM (alkaline phosphatase superfamily)